MTDDDLGTPPPAETGEGEVGDVSADHAAIDRLADELVPALMAKLTASGLGEIEVREGVWRIRVRRPAGPVATLERRSAERPSRAQPGHAGHGHGPAGFEGHRSARDGRGSTAALPAGSTNGSTPAGVSGGGGSGSGVSSGGGPERHRAFATSPAVGVYQPRSEARPGNRVRAGDLIGVVDMLGVLQEVVAPSDGIVGASLVEAGQAVEYGQELIVIELASGLPAEA
jgi:biotin carboxyl carrier protein